MIFVDQKFVPRRYGIVVISARTRWRSEGSPATGAKCSALPVAMLTSECDREPSSVGRVSAMTKPDHDDRVHAAILGQLVDAKINVAVWSYLVAELL